MDTTVIVSGNASKHLEASPRDPIGLFVVVLAQKPQPQMLFPACKQASILRPSIDAFPADLPQLDVDGLKLHRAGRVLAKECSLARGAGVWC